MTSVIADYIANLTPKAKGQIRGTARLEIIGHGSVMLYETGATAGNDRADAVLIGRCRAHRQRRGVSQHPLGRTEPDHRLYVRQAQGRRQRSARPQGQRDPDGLNPQERLRQSGDHRAKAQRCIRGGKTNAIGPDIGHRRVV